MNNTSDSLTYGELSPDEILNAVESLDYKCDGHVFALNSYENRVYQIGLENNDPLVAKFYRPGRWSNPAILEEHRYTIELLNYEIPVIAPIEYREKTLHEFNNFRFAVFPRRGGHAIESGDADQLRMLGRFVARIHNVGASENFEYRPALEIEEFGINAYRYLLTNNFIPFELETAYQSLAEDIIERVKNCYLRAGDINLIRLHGDCHHGNILLRDEELFILDFDDARTGPAIQDMWMFLSGDRGYMTDRMNELLEGYTEFREFDFRELHLIEALRSLRMLHHSAWIARRWSDPAFPLAFPYFNTQKYWQDQILALREQAALMDEPPLECRSF